MKPKYRDSDVHWDSEEVTPQSQSTSWIWNQNDLSRKQTEGCLKAILPAWYVLEEKITRLKVLKMLIDGGSIMLGTTLNIFTCTYSWQMKWALFPLADEEVGAESHSHMT